MIFPRWGVACLLLLSFHITLFGDDLQNGAPQYPLVVHKPAPVEGYSIAPDGGLIYDPLTREAQKTGELRDPGVATEKRSLTLGDARLEVSIPPTARAYEVVPVPYQLFPGRNTTLPAAVEAVGFEDEDKRQGRDLFDLSLPGKIDFKVDYLGSATAHLLPAEKHNITADFSDTPKRYPNFTVQPMVQSGIVEAGDLVWFKFRLTNTGNTIMDGQGLGGALLSPKLLRKDADGTYKQFATTYNLYYRILDYWYPGKTWEPWIIFNIPKAGEPAEYYALEPGDYKIQIDVVFRSYQTPDTAIDEWAGPVVYSWEQPLTVAAKPAAAPVLAGAKLPAPEDIPNKLPKFIHTFEQFMTAFDCYTQFPSATASDGNAASPSPIKGVLHLQVAPWTKQVVVRLMTGSPPAVTTAAIPIEVDSKSLSIKLPAHLPHVVFDASGKPQPIFQTQTMADMRTNVQLGPHPEKYIRDELSEMKELGVNVLQTTSMPWEFDDSTKPTFNFAGDALNYSLDLARQDKLPVGVWGQYPFDRATIGTIATWISGKDYAHLWPVQGTSYASSSQLDPRLAEANGVAVLYNFDRWGDLFNQESNGNVPINIEDTRGWLRDDINIRYPVGVDATFAFRKWLKARYTDIATLNKAWGTSFASFTAIDPETHVPDASGVNWGYGDNSNPFHDWTPAVEDFDIWRTLVRVKNYRDLISAISPKIPNAKMEVRTEGGNAFIAGIDPETPNAHFRHAYYNQRRIGGIAEILDASGVIAYHGDYTTVPYTPSELRFITRTAVAQGITPAYLPQFNDMRDIAINDKIGRSYQTSYNLDTPQKGFMMHVLTASYPWYQIMLEEGAIPGILWEDYQCDGYVTETQKQELQFYQQKLNEALAKNPLLSKDYPVPSQDWKKASHATRSYNLETPSP
jgi:Beta-galactosidase